MIILQLAVTFVWNDEFRYRNELSFREFFSEDLFEDVKQYIDRPLDDYRVVSIGLYPAILQYNGFYTLDFYLPFYPLEYREKFRNIIEPELNKNSQLKEEFEEGSNSVYMLVDELGYDFTVTNEQNVKINNLTLNIEPLKELGANYIISAAEIMNYNENGLEFMKSFTDDNSKYKIYLYGIK